MQAYKGQQGLLLRDADHRKWQYVATMPTSAIWLTISWQCDMVVNPVGRHSSRSAVQHWSNIAATNFYI